MPPPTPSAGPARSLVRGCPGVPRLPNHYETNEKSTFSPLGLPTVRHSTQERPRSTQESPKTPQEHPKRRPGEPQETPQEPPRAPLRPPGAPQECLRTPKERPERASELPRVGLGRTKSSPRTIPKRKNSISSKVLHDPLLPMRGALRTAPDRP